MSKTYKSRPIRLYRRTVRRSQIADLQPHVSKKTKQVRFADFPTYSRKSRMHRPRYTPYPNPCPT